MTSPKIRMTATAALALLAVAFSPACRGPKYPEGLYAEIDTRSWPVPPIFKFLQSVGVKRDEMFRVFNMGIGYTLIVRSAFANAIVGHFRRQGLDAVAIGRIRKGPTTVELVR
jgi:phosphoribosylformylglycinamidine cyclo-ligase